MAVNTVRPPQKTPPRANVPREVAAPMPVPEVVPEPTHVPEPEPKEEPEPYRAPRRPPSTWSVFTVVDRIMRMDGLFREGLPVRYLPHLLFVMFLTLLYIGNTHYATRMNRNIQKLKLETEDLRADFTTLSSDYMEASKQSEVARKVAAYGLVESSSPPFRIKVPAGRLDEAQLDRLPVITADSMAARAVADSLARLAAEEEAGALPPDSVAAPVRAPRMIEAPKARTKPAKKK
ncbi:FtsL-like putative cell division protein [Hymenobacter defluvii]|uniref:Cell division protein FtsL n=1 Tax=Hymenobacter defluvii TaxID=2054411 RepID=A0ABS3TDE9_9BACT|nr:FtsL-like putative cell division protein [Hymenobacter defluvii]MBO3271686.1 hypothetical protein [Hymenobacter defluvii]